MVTHTQKRVAKVLERIAAEVLNDRSAAISYSIEMDDMLDQMNFCDAFGAEGQFDPRGDMRNSEWTMERVEGVDE